MFAQTFLECSMNATVTTRIVRTCNSCTKCVGNPGIIHYRTPGCNPISSAWTTSKLNVASIRNTVGTMTQRYNPGMFGRTFKNDPPIIQNENCMNVQVRMFIECSELNA